MERKAMNVRIIILLFLAGLFYCAAVFGQSEGEKLFNQVCVACHTVGQGRLIGPDLAGVQQRRSEEWLLKFIRSSQTVIQSGDPVAAALFEEYNKIPMPDNNYSDDQIRAVISYIAENSPGGPGAAETGGISPAPGRPLSEAGEENIQAGKNLFEGRTRLANGGPTCNSCHNVKNDALLGGGALAKDLTDAYSRLGEAGVKAILGNPPFPAMKQAYQNRLLSEAEIFDLTAFLQHADQVSNTQQAKNYRTQLLFTGLGGAVVLLLVFGGVWTRSKRGSVNRKIYERQIKSI